MDWTAELAEANTNLATYRKAAPEVGVGFSGLAKASMSPGAIDLKHKELMCIAIGIARQCTDCIGFHVKAAIRAGATREEVADCVSVSIYMGGGPAFMYGARALEAYDQLAG
ncbi:carboxymuconolactone decarboxylase family protein [Frigidibacter sp. ROC022]|uniref:carboxymuconolactone decarboxylase family protein n=1 Tax=Frigidibacter sp. ROC022 TaxID=2971796 RepID=UPI00215A2039|nr:carboxymuconolactone decarboxylase family protein [Frigidibacter sp. ROC022]MCR8723638.1 carboxymuconolactone decarboxylase family protein [Frigidibacter sp. ROC022]